jgi:hypothetical protein
MTRQRIASIARLASLLFSGVFAGFLVAALVIELSLRQFDGSVYTQVQHVLLLGLPSLASATLIPALVSTAVLAIAAGWRTGRLLPLSALGLLVVAFVVSLTVNVPINARELGWSVESPPADWMSLRDSWQLAHLGRTVAALAAFVLLTVAAVRRPRSAPDADAPASAGATRAPSLRLP